MEELVLGGVALLVATIVGVVEFIKALGDRNWRAAVIIAVAGIVGYFFGSMPEIGVTNLQGAVIGFAASGAVTWAKMFQGPKPEAG